VALKRGPDGELSLEGETKRVLYLYHLTCVRRQATVKEIENTDLRPLWKAHQLTGERKGVWSLHVTRNWRLTFQIKDGEIWDVDYEDYH
jgi:plasmid maintenance system killer protein